MVITDYLMGHNDKLYFSCLRSFRFILRKFLTIIFLLSTCSVISQIPPASQIIDSKICDQTSRFPITKYFSILKTEKYIPIQTVLSPEYENKFQKAENKAVIFSGYDPYYYWFRFIISNDEERPKDLVMLMAPMGMKDGVLYQKENNTWKAKARNGLIYPFSKRPYQYSYFVFPFTVPSKSIDTLYLSMDARHAYKSYGFALMQEKALRTFQNKVYFAFGFIVGLLMLFSLFNFYLYFSLKDKVHLWYAVYIALLIWIVLKHDQLDQEFLSSNPEFTFRLAPLMGIAAFSIALLMHLIQHILTNIKRGSFLYNISVIAKLNALISGLAHTIVFHVQPNYQIEQFVFTWADKSTIICIVVIIIDCIYSIYKGLNSAIFLLAGMIVFFIGAITRLLLVTISSYLFPPSLFHLGMVLETVIISFGLIYRYRLDRKEKEQYRKEKEELKNSFDKLLLQSKFEIQEQTLKNVSQEIHDNIGQVLSLVKLNIQNLTAGNMHAGDTKLDLSANLLTKAIADLRDLSRTLNTDYIMEKGFSNSVEYTLEQIKRFGNYTIELKITGEPNRIEPQKELILFRMFQEILNNIIKHAKANCITVDINYTDDKLDLQVTDNGKGFDTNIMNNKNDKSGLGVRNLRSRADLLNATYNISSTEKGTSVFISLPV